MSFLVRTVTAGALLIGAAALAGCTALPRPRSDGEDLFVAGDLARAAAALERELAAAPPARVKERILVRLATVYASPGATFDAERSQAMVDRLLREVPHTRLRTEALVLRRMTGQLVALAERVVTVETEVAGLARDAERCRGRLAAEGEARAELERTAGEEVASRRACEQSLAALRRRALERDQEIGRLNEAVAALEKLRRIDTEADPGGR